MSSSRDPERRREISARDRLARAMKRYEIPGQHLTREEWGRVVRDLQQQTVQAFVRLGLALIRAKEDIPYGEWAPFLAYDVQMSDRTAQKLMSLAGNATIANPIHESDSPCDYNSLSVLARLEPPALEQAIENGEIKADMTRKVAETVARVYSGGPGEPPQPRRRPPRGDTGATFIGTMKRLLMFDWDAHVRLYPEDSELWGLIEELRDKLAGGEEIRGEAGAGDGDR